MLLILTTLLLSALCSPAVAEFGRLLTEVKKEYPVEVSTNFNNVINKSRLSRVTPGLTNKRLEIYRDYSCGEQDYEIYSLLATVRGDSFATVNIDNMFQHVEVDLPQNGDGATINILLLCQLPVRRLRSRMSRSGNRHGVN